MNQKINNASIIKHALILAAGRGLRMQPLTDKIPKAMAPISGSTLIAERIYELKKHISNVHITVGYKGSILAKYVIEKDVNSVFNTEGKGNAWWIYNTPLKNLNEPLLVLTCDNIFDFNYKKFCNDYFTFNLPACMIVPAKYSKIYEADKILYDQNNMVKKIDRNIKSESICSGVQIINPYKINQSTEKCENFNDVWKQLIINKDIFCSNYLLKNWHAVDNLYQLDKMNSLRNV
mgnify:CR=1 FL=1